MSMATIWYILIPLFLVAVAVAVIPVLYGTIKHEHWERNEAALKEHQRSGVIAVDPVEYPQARRAHMHVALQDARAEARELLTRIEHLERFGAQTDQEAPESARLMATAGASSRS